MQTGKNQEILNSTAQVIEERFELHERQAAQDLIRDAFHLLPWELQDLYHGVVELYREGKLEQANALFEIWMEKARDLDLI